MKSLIRLLAALLMVLPVSVSADDFGGDDPDLASDNEEWYLHFALNRAFPSYSDNVKSAAGTFSGGFPIGADFGVYVPLSDNLILGGTLAAVADMSTDILYNTTVNRGYVGGGAAYFFGTNTGDGLFVRAEAGFATVTIEKESISVFSGVTKTEFTKYGFSLRAGAGYGLPLSRGVRMLFHGGVMWTNASGYAMIDPMLGFGVLW